MATIGPLLTQRRFDEARPLLETLLDLEPEQREARKNLRLLASEVGNPEEARLLLRRAVVANAGDTHAQGNAQLVLALAAMRLGDKAEARQALETAIELEPQNSFALRNLVSLLVIAGAFAAGVTWFRQALQLCEGFDQYRFIAVLSVVFAMGQGGLQMYEPGTSRNLQTLPGSCSDLALACSIGSSISPGAGRNHPPPGQVSVIICTAPWRACSDHAGPRKGWCDSGGCRSFPHVLPLS